MNIQNVKRIQVKEKVNAPEPGEIKGHPRVTLTRPASSVDLDPTTLARSLGKTDGRQQGHIDVLTERLGPSVTWGSVAWTDGAKPRMRALQKQLLETGLTLGEGDRQAVLDAITVIENDFALRIRLEQHQMMDNQIMAAAPQAPGGKDA